MSKNQDNNRALDEIIEEMVNVVSNSKQEIFELGEDSRKQQEALANEVVEIKRKVQVMIDENDQLERKLKLSRQRLTEVSRHFDEFSEEEVRKVYNDAHELQTKLLVQRQQETGLIKRRDELEARIKSLDGSIERTENVMSKITVVLTYLTQDFQSVNETITTAQDKYDFGLQIIDAQEEERRKLSREIHDGPAQMLANVLIRSDIVKKTIRERGVDEAMREMKEVKEMVRSSLYEVRRIIYDLRPMALDDLGLVPTLRKYLSTMEEYHSIKIEFQSKGKEYRYSQKFEAAVFRLVQEGVQNALKHAGGSLISVRLEQTQSKLNVHIVDNGKGFDPDVKKDGSFGLMGMRERVEMLNGDFKISSEPNKGTKVIISMPAVF
ncbi:sensor histidine kinase [Halalkalibacillus halophilus]|uniref:sensor histidine kinase n=1 Tax=Halalkalibacillus halophilus TaxID=392827 RepID=UPI0003FD9B11|nr:sensor histidine kinase [Halalkalibacillus halophilus]